MRFLLFLLLVTLARAAETRVLFLGDSITYDGRWAAWTESALRHDPAYADADFLNLGLGSETTSGLSEEGHAGGQFPRPCIHERLGRVLERCKPTLVIACYGMNDGIYKPLDEARMDAYRKGMTKLKDEVEKTGAKIVFVTPSLYFADRPMSDAAHYDAVLDAQAAWLKSMQGWQVVDVRPGLREKVAAAKKKEPDVTFTKDGPGSKPGVATYVRPGFVFAEDGVHPGWKGHRFFAEALCQGLWPVLGLKGEPRFASDASYIFIQKRAAVLRDAFLTETKHKRPGVPAGKPVPEALEEAKGLLENYRAMDSAKVSEWSGYKRLDFTVDGRAALLVVPKQSAAGMPWIWRTEFFGHEPQGDIALLEKGFHVAYIDMQDMYGAPVAMKHMDAYYDFVVPVFGLSKKTVLEGFSRGGLFAFNWAALHPERCAALYVDNPVCDFKSWPAAKGASKGGSPGDWQKLLKAYGMTEAEALAYKKNPIDNLEPLKGSVPILAVIGMADDGVPPKENIDLVEERYKQLGGKIEIIRKPGEGHHPHSLKDPTPIVEFVVKAVGG
ncbi:alpha/beta fold hydrolase [Haloferula sp. BvORR071]|uniref:alpha/beta fold hydrolase n=1 Tax=Haloferula sp. BvORR071 TaxID=1396141 RepID=UPI000696FCC1|nr:alpha/beta fold hydrolase [Haloferula sp. BvORR071]